MAEPTFDHERLDVYRLSIDYVAFSYQIARTLRGVNRQARDQGLRAAQSILRNIAEGNGKQSLKDKNRFLEIARGTVLECAAIHDVLQVCDSIDDDSNSRGKTDLKRIVSMLTGLIQRTAEVSEESIEYEYRDAEYEYEPTAETGRTKPGTGAADNSGLGNSHHPGRPVTGGVRPATIEAPFSRSSDDVGYRNAIASNLRVTTREGAARIADRYPPTERRITGHNDFGGPTGRDRGRTFPNAGYGGIECQRCRRGVTSGLSISAWSQRCGLAWSLALLPTTTMIAC